MSLTAAELRAVYSVDEGPLDRSLQGMGGKVQSTFGKVAAAAAGFFAFDKLSEGFFAATGAASDLNETVNKSDTIFGANAAAISQWAQGSAKNLGMSRQQALDAAAGFGDMFSQIGFAGDQAADMSKKVVQMSADLGSFNNLPTEDVAQRISAAFRGEYDSLQALIPNINAARVEQEAMAATGKTNASELTAQEKAAAVLAIVNKDGARAMGDFAKTSDGAANSAKIATAQWEDQKAKIGQGLLPVLKVLVSFVSGVLVPAIGAGFEFARQVVTAFVNAWKYNDGEVTSSGLPGFFERVGYIARQVFDFISGAVTAFANAWKYADGEVTSSGFNGFMERAGYVARLLANVLTGTVLPAIGSFAGFLIANRQPLLIIAGIIAALFIPHLIALAAQSVLTNATMAAMWLASKVGAIQAAAVHSAQVVAMVAGWVLMGVQSMIRGAQMAAAWVLAMGPVGWVIALVVGLVALIVANWDTVVSWTTTAWSAVTGAVVAAWEWIKGAVSAGIDFLVNLFLNFTGPGLIIKHWETIKQAFSAGVSAVVGFVRDLPGKILGFFANAGSWLLDAGKNLLEGLWNGISGSVSWLKKKILDWAGNLLPGWVKDILGIDSPSTVFAEMGRYLMLGMAVGIDGEAKTAVTAAARAAAAITDAMQVQAPDLMGLANQQASAALAVRRPAGMTTGATAAGAAGQTGTAGGSTGPLVNIEGDYVAQNNTTPAQNASALAVEVRTRPWT